MYPFVPKYRSATKIVLFCLNFVKFLLNLSLKQNSFTTVHNRMLFFATVRSGGIVKNM